MASRSAPRPVAAATAAAALVVISLPLAAPGPALVPAAAAGEPRWLSGLYGAGFGISAGPYLALLYVAVAAWIVLVPFARTLGRRRMSRLGGGLIVLFALAPPLLSLDVFSYIAYARLGTEHGLNPYEFAPVAIPSDQAALRVQDFRDAVSVYGPLFTLVSYPLGALGVPAALWSLKALGALCVGLIAVLTARLARVRGVEPLGAATLVALNPLVLVHVVGGAHNDSLMALLALLAIAAALGSRPAGAGAALAASVAVKAGAALYAPFLLVGSRERGRLVLGFAAAALAAAAVGLAVFGTGVGEALGVAGGNQASVSRWSVPGALGRLTGIDVGILRVIAGAGYALTLVGLLRWVARGADWVRAAGWGALGLLVASAYMVPWYLIWLLPLAAISRDRALIAATVGLTVFQVVNGVPI